MHRRSTHFSLQSKGRKGVFGVAISVRACIKIKQKIRGRTSHQARAWEAEALGFVEGRELPRTWMSQESCRDDRWGRGCSRFIKACLRLVCGRGEPGFVGRDFVIC